MSQLKVGDVVQIRLTSYSDDDRVGIVIDVVNDGMDALVFLQDGAMFVDRMLHFKRL